MFNVYVMFFILILCFYKLFSNTEDFGYTRIERQVFSELSQHSIIKPPESSAFGVMNHMIKVDSIVVDFDVLLFKILLWKCLNFSPELFAVHSKIFKDRLLHITVYKSFVKVPKL